MMAPLRAGFVRSQLPSMPVDVGGQGDEPGNAHERAERGEGEGGTETADEGRAPGGVTGDGGCSAQRKYGSTVPLSLTIMGFPRRSFAVGTSTRTQPSATLYS